MPLFYFLMGALFIAYIIPLLDTLLAYITSAINAKIYKIKQTITSESDTSVGAIGFVYEKEEEDDNYDL